MVAAQCCAYTRFQTVIHFKVDYCRTWEARKDRRVWSSRPHTKFDAILSWELPISKTTTINTFSYCCDRNSDQSNLREKGFTLAHSSMLQPIMVVKFNQQYLEIGLFTCSKGTDSEEWFAWSAFFFPSTKSHLWGWHHIQ